MMSNTIILVITLLLVFTMGKSFRCDRRPYGLTNHASPSDGRFKLIVLGIENNAYIPDQLYTVKIIETDGKSRFTAFMISAEGDTKTDPRNPRRIISLFPGEIRPINSMIAKFSNRCHYSVEQAMNSMKSSVEVYWQAPESGNGCVTLRAMVVEDSEVWFEDGAPLTQKLCEDMRQPDDIAPQINYECAICDEAKYEVGFTGVWSRNTHPQLFPENDWVPRYSDMVGASHSAEFILWAPGSLASDGLKDLAEHTNTTLLEAEIIKEIGEGARTLIKGKGHGYRRMSETSYSFFRTDKSNHLFTVAVGIHPSPDWFLGVSRFELCQDNAWLRERELNLYPWDAGTDSGISYESPNMATFPQDAVTRVEMSSYDKNSPFFEMDIKDMHPFGKLHIKLVRTYQRDCEEVIDATTTYTAVTETESTTETDDAKGESTTEAKESGEGTDENKEESKEVEKQSEPEEPSRYHNPAIDSSAVGSTTDSPAVVVDPEYREDCPVTKWSAWSSCEGPCIDGKINGYQWRERYHLVDGIAVEKYDPNVKHPYRKAVSKYCKTHVDVFERNDCEEICSDKPQHNDDEEDDTHAERRTMDLVPGLGWNKRRDANKIKNLRSKTKSQ